ESEIARFNRVNMMGELAASLSHEIKQPIAAAIMNARTAMRWLEREPPDTGEALDALSSVVNATANVADIIDRNYSLYRRGAAPQERVDRNEITRQMVVLMRDVANRQSISIRATLDPALPTTAGDRVQLHQVLMNLMLNGIEAMTEGRGELNI